MAGCMGKKKNLMCKHSYDEVIFYEFQLPIKASYCTVRLVNVHIFSYLFDSECVGKTIKIELTGVQPCYVDK